MEPTAESEDKPDPKSTTNQSQLIAACILGGLSSYLPMPPRFRRPSERRFGRPCLYCRKLHNHNNSYCSAECCRAHREKGKNA